MPMMSQNAHGIKNQLLHTDELSDTYILVYFCSKNIGQSLNFVAHLHIRTLNRSFKYFLRIYMSLCQVRVCKYSKLGSIIYPCCQVFTIQVFVLTEGGRSGGDAASGTSLGQTAASADLGGRRGFALAPTAEYRCDT